ncbi:DUF397 domain-containing protein [Streptomyces armeniacus]|uniref:DUF397 domain-containing protein n=1 Tax=Streptomyces armeniacus TaxID=83291 RepID=A0A345XI06_9ACTN|nr:DUF397 domain-containing protein [Streptomyces armeniacus]AXK31272.1 DUF397 domain-containing protein [Streptomyces armeniacus]
MSVEQLAWFKSSYSGSDGDNCLEVAMEWRRSSHSGSGGDNCVEVATCPQTVHVRDSKDTRRPGLALTPDAWAAFVAHAAGARH